MRSSDIWRELGVELLLLFVKKSQLWCFGHLIKMPPGRPYLEVFWAYPTGLKPQGRPRTRRRDYISHLAWERLRIPQEKYVWSAALHLLLLHLDPGSEEENGWMMEKFHCTSLISSNSVKRGGSGTPLVHE